MNRWLAAILLHSLQMALTAPEFICLMVSALQPSVSAALFSFTFLTHHLKSAEVKGLCAWDEELPCMLSNESGIIRWPSYEWSAYSLWMCSFAPRTPSEVRVLTAVAPSSSALVSASALFTGLKEPYLRTTLGMFHSSLSIPFSE